MKAPVIEVSHVDKNYGQGDTRVQALSDVNFEIYPGEFTALIGPSGSGKSTLLNVISALDVPTSGTVKLAGRDLASMTGAEVSDFRRDRIGFIFQSYNLIPVLSAEENVEYVMLLQKVPAKERRQRARDMLKQVGLEGKESRRPGELSGGQQQRVAVARAIVSRPSIVLADEPTANLDSKTGSELIDMMRGLNETLGMTFVFSTHDEHIMAQARRHITLRDGRVESDVSR